jgi:hypothetical protein
MFVSFALVIVLIPTSLALGIYMVLFIWLIIIAFKMGMVYQQVGKSAAVASRVPGAEASPSSPLEPRSIAPASHDKPVVLPVAHEGVLGK